MGHIGGFTVAPPRAAQRGGAMTPEARESSEGLVLRIGAVSSVVGVAVLFVAEAFHGGHDPGNLSATLPVYAANRIWELVHIAQFVGYLLLLLGLLAVYRSMHDGRSGTIARIGFVTAVVATAIFAVNQAVDGVAVKFVADQWVSAPTPQKAETFRIANAVRHVEIGTTSFSQLTFGLALLLNGLALALARSYPRLLGWAGMVLGGRLRGRRRARRPQRVHGGGLHRHGGDRACVLVPLSRLHSLA